MQLKQLLKDRGLVQMDIGRALWPDSDPSTQKINAWKLVNGKSGEKMDRWTAQLCKLLSCTPNDIFNIKP